jgi:hypothetical protein
MLKYVSAAAVAFAMVTGSIGVPALAEAKKEQTEAQKAMHERQKKCGDEWKEAKVAGKVEKGMTWPKYWSACNKRLKGA